MSKINRFSETWKVVASHCNERLASARNRLEGQLTADETNAIRAQIRELKVILSLVEHEEPATNEPEEIIL